MKILCWFYQDLAFPNKLRVRSNPTIWGEPRPASRGWIVLAWKQMQAQTQKHFGLRSAKCGMAERASTQAVTRSDASLPRRILKPLGHPGMASYNPRRRESAAPPPAENSCNRTFSALSLAGLRNVGRVGLLLEPPAPILIPAFALASRHFQVHNTPASTTLS